jgi:hypothetical protein
MADGTFELILIGSTNVMKISGDLQDLQVPLFHLPDVKAKTMDPLSVIPVMAGVRVGEAILSMMLNVN